MQDRLTILVIEDDQALRSGIRRLLERRGDIDCLEVDSVAGALRALQESKLDVVLLDVHLPDGHAREVLACIATLQPKPGVIVMTADDLAGAELSVHRDVDSYLLKPFSFGSLDAALTQVLVKHGKVAQEASPRRPQAPMEEWRKQFAPDLLGEDPRLLRVFRTIQSVADTDCSVLVTGESGTGKELVARAIHASSGRVHGPFVTVNCAAMPEHLVESELFGHARGAFTGAVAPHIGRFVAADGGTLFLDEIGELPLSQQAKLLRAVQEKEVMPVGQTKVRKVDVRLIAATHRDLEAMVDEGTFREDLLYRVQVVPVELPSLRDRCRDVALLVNHFVRRSNQKRNRAVTGITPQALSSLERFHWPGNVRQLENLVDRMVLLRSEGEIGIEDLPARILGKTAEPAAAGGPLLPEEGIDLRDAIEQFENALILQALERTGWNKNRAATMLRMNRTTLVEKLKKKQFPDGPSAN